MADDSTSLIERLLGTAPPTVLLAHRHGRAGVDVLDDGTFEFLLDGEVVHRGCSSAETTDGRKIDTRRAEQGESTVTTAADPLGDARVVETAFRAGDLTLTRSISLIDSGEIVVQVHLESAGGEVETRFLAPFTTPYPHVSARPVFLSLDQKMLRAPYDNDMWGRWESSVPETGRESFDVAAIYDEHTLEGLVVGALDYDVWKNAIRWDGLGARSITAYSGAASLATRDILPHRAVSGRRVSSSRFVVFWTDDVKRGMERFADLCLRIRPARAWTSGVVPFGWNSYSGLGLRTTVETWTTAGDFVIDELPDYRDEDGVVYVNLDGAFGLDLDEVGAQVERIHAAGHRAGWYIAPCGWFEALADRPALGTDLTMGDLFLRDDQGEVMPKIDAMVPLDTTHPAWEDYARASVRRIVDLGFDYIKIDFLTHASVEGRHHDERSTGRMALDRAYRVLSDEIERAEKEIFVSLSIAPLFPYFLGHARRASCDVFGRFDDVRYVLNSQNFSWWTSGRLYRFNDPDHTPLFASEIDGREPSSFAEARSRYLASIIGGTVMMLSDDYGPTGDPERTEAARERARRLADSAAVNEVARIGRAFVPVELADGTTPFYTLSHGGRHFAALFNFAPERRELTFEARRGELPDGGRLRDLYSGEEIAYRDRVTWTLDGWDAVLLEVLPEEGR